MRLNKWRTRFPNKAMLSASLCSPQNVALCVSMNNEIEVFIQNLAGSHIKNQHNETTLEHVGSIELFEPYPFAYGFIPKTIAADGDCLDCYLLSPSDLIANSRIRCIPIGVLEQFENEEPDHKILAVLRGESEKVDPIAIEKLRHFINRASQQFTATSFAAGAVLDQFAAFRLISGARHNFLYT